MRDRRTLLAVVAAVAVAPAALALPARPDAEVIALCHRYSELWSEWNHLCRYEHIEGSPEALAYDTALNQIEAIAEPMLDLALPMPCTTLEGFKALATWDQEILKEDNGAVIPSVAAQQLASNQITRVRATLKWSKGSAAGRNDGDGSGQSRFIELS